MRGLAIAGFVGTAAMIAAACSSSSTSDGGAESEAAVADARTDAPVPACGFVITNQSGPPSGACGTKGSSCTTTGPGPCNGGPVSYSCSCDGSWTCLSSEVGGGSCDAGNPPPIDSGRDADIDDGGDLDASDADAS